MQEMYEFKLRFLTSVRRHLLTTGIVSSYINWVYHGEPVNLDIGMQTFDEILGMLDGLQANIEQVEEMKEDLDLEEDKTNVVFKELINQTKL